MFDYLKFPDLIICFVSLPNLETTQIFGTYCSYILLSERNHVLENNNYGAANIVIILDHYAVTSCSEKFCFYFENVLSNLQNPIELSSDSELASS